ncbi:hypothetical protein R3P38DRAFT_3192964 [Favolaschia claudopus]|uniref:Uncharacterized protein n=1 Tax=Favolaschia claudopus TaxID=2862362 RepID=A0AAW0BK67_9AGAR
MYPRLCYFAPHLARLVPDYFSHFHTAATCSRLYWRAFKAVTRSYHHNLQFEGSLLNLTSHTAYGIGHKCYNYPFYSVVLSPHPVIRVRNRCVKGPRPAIRKGSDVD